MSDTDKEMPVVLTSQHDAYAEAIKESQAGNQLYVVLRLLEQLQLSLPDKATVQSTFSLIAQILPALANVASKENVLELSRRIGAIEAAMGKVSQTAALNDRDVQQLKEGQTTIKDALRTESSRIEKGADDKKRELEKQIDGNSGDLKALRGAVDALVQEVGRVRADNGRYLLTTVIAIILFVSSVSAFFLGPLMSQKAATTIQAPPAIVSQQKPASSP